MKPKLPRQSTTQLYSVTSSSSQTSRRTTSSASLSSSASLTRSNTEITRRPSLRQQSTQLSRSQTQILEKKASANRTGSSSKQISENGSVHLRQKSSVQNTSQLSSKSSSERSQSDIRRKTSLTIQQTSSSTQLKRKSSSLPKGPSIKRTRKAPARFASVEEKKSAVKRKAENTEQKILYYNKGDFLAVKSDEDEDGFFLCKALQHVYKSTKQFMIQWLNKDESTGVYSTDYCDFTEPDCIVVEVKLGRQGRGSYSLPAGELTRIQNALAGQLSDEEEEEQEADEPKPKRSKGTQEKNAKKKVKKVKGVKDKKVKAVKEKKQKPKKERTKKEKKEKPKKEKKIKPPKVVKRKGPNRKLVPNPDITVYDEDPLFYGREKVPFVSPQAHSKLVFRAVLLNDSKLLNEFINDRKNIAWVNYERSSQIKETPINYAVRMRNTKAVEALIKELSHSNHFGSTKKERVKAYPVLLSTVGTGSYNPLSLGLPAIRPLAMSRGCREGNNAFSKDPSCSHFNIYSATITALQEGVELDFINKMYIAADVTHRHQLYTNVVHAVRRGHRKLAGKIIEETEKQLGPSSFNFLHKEVLLFDNEDLRPLRAVSVTKKPMDNDGMLPIHCAAINPNVKYLTALMSVCPEYDIPDKRNRRPAHYAAVCETTATLEFLVSHGARMEDQDNAGMTPLMVAAEAGALHNVEFLLKHAKAEADKKDGEEENPHVVTNKFGIGQINRPNKQGFTALHLAVQNRHLDVMKTLLEYGADIKRKLSATKNRLTPLMIACEVGDYETVKYFNEINVPIEQTDKLGRTALIHAVLNGHAHIASFLLSLGADPKASDSSGNSCIHYAVAYGWYHCFKLLLQGGADPNQLNDWKMQPLSIAFLKGHRGLVDLLLEQPGVDINYPDERGMTLLAILCGSHLTEDVKSQIQYLVKEKKADCTVKDINGNTCLHHLANQKVKINSWYREEKFDDERIALSVDIATLLIRHGCSPNDENNDSVTPMKLALQEINIKLLKFFIKEGGFLESSPDKEGKTALHHLAEQCTELDLSPLLKDLVSKSSSGKCRDVVFEMAKAFDHEGYNPLMRACLQYCGSDWNSHEMRKRGLSFMETLISSCQSDINATVQRNKPKDSSTEPKYGRYGKQNVLHMICSFCLSETGLPSTMRMLLKHAPDLENMDCDGNTMLIRAINAPNLEVFKILVKAGADVNLYKDPSEVSKKDSKYWENRHIMKAPLLQAIERDQEEMIKILLDKGADISAKTDEGNTAVHLLVTHGRQRKYAPSMIKQLVDMGCGINDRNEKLRTPFHLAVNGNVAGIDASTEFEESLMSLGADLFAKDIRGRLPLHYAFVKIGRHTDSSTFDPIELCSNLCIAMKFESLDLADLFGRTPLHYAAYRGATVCCMYLLKRKAEMEATCNNGTTPLALAVLGGQESCAMMLIQKEANINVDIVVGDKNAPVREPTPIPDDKKPKFWVWKPVKPIEQKKVTSTYTEYPLFRRCVMNGWQGLIYIILDVLEKYGIPFSQTVEASLVCGKFNLALTLMRKAVDDAQLCTVNEQKRSLLHILTQQTFHSVPQDLYKRVAEELSQVGVSLTSKDDRQMSPLHYAVLNNHSKVVKFLVEEAATLDMEQIDEFGRPALAALFWRQPQDWNTFILDYMMKRKPNLDILVDYCYKEEPLFGFSAVKKADYYVGHDQSKVSPLILAVIHHQVEIVKQLIRNGASVNFCDELGRTPLMHAIMRNDEELVKILLKNLPATDRYARKSKSAVNVCDHNGQTALHYVAAPLPRGSFDNVSILKQLQSAGADENVKNRAGQTALELALSHGSPDVATSLQGGSRNRKEEFEAESAVFEDGIEWDTDIPDAAADAEAMLEKIQNEATDFDDVPDPLNSPDPELNMEDTAEVVMDDSQNVPYSVLMTKIDVSFGPASLYNFYKMQVVRQKGKDLYILFNRWGRIGDQGNFQQTPFPSKDAAIKEFCKIFKAKTKNNWEELEKFENHWGKYRLVQADERKRSKKLKGIEFSLKSDLPSRLPEQLQSMLREVTDVTAMHRAMGDCGVDMTYMPFGQIKKEALEHAIQLLNQLKECCETLADIRETLSTDQGKLTSYHDELSKICKLTNEYYHLIPQSGFQYERVAPLDNIRSIDAKLAKVYDLLELEFASKVLAAAQFRVNEINPLDYVYRCMECQISVLEEDALETQYLLKYIHASQGSRKIEAIFRVCRPGEEERINSCGVDNPLLLFHGSNTCNLLSILHHGLLIAPSNAQISGHMFGKGIYSSDIFSKSVGYCYNWGTNSQKKFMLMCEVAVGNPYRVTQHEQQTYDKYTSVLGVGQSSPDPTYDVKLPTGETIRLGQLETKKDHRSYCVSCNEYIVYKADQVRLRYIVQFN